MDLNIPAVCSGSRIKKSYFCFFFTVKKVFQKRKKVMPSKLSYKTNMADLFSSTKSKFANNLINEHDHFLISLTFY